MVTNFPPKICLLLRARKVVKFAQALTIQNGLV